MNEQKTPKAAPAMNNPETLARARIRITDIGAAASVEAWREDIGIARCPWLDRRLAVRGVD